MDAAKSRTSISSTVPMTESNIRTLVPSSRSPNVSKPSHDSVATNDALAVGQASISDIEGLMADLQAARDYLQAEGERVRQINANYAHLAQTASASARVIAESIGKWLTPEEASGHQPPAAMGPSVFPEGKTSAETFEVQPALEMMEQQLTEMTAPSKPR
jgi:hypothetical protein